MSSSSNVEWQPVPQTPATPTFRANFLQASSSSYDPLPGEEDGRIELEGGRYPRLSHYSRASSYFSSSPTRQRSPLGTPPGERPPTQSMLSDYSWNYKDVDLVDEVEDRDFENMKDLSTPFTLFTLRGWVNIGTILVLTLALIMLFAGYPVVLWIKKRMLHPVSYNIVTTNGTGQVPNLPGLRTLIDPDTDQSVYTRTGNDGYTYNLVFSDEFNLDGRTFYPGDDPYWEAADMHYWATGDLEWYSPDAVTTEDGKLVLTMTEMDTHNLNFQSGMLQSWNKLCFTTGYIEVSLSLPGSASAPGFWPAAWTMGNLGRAGYGATTDGMWPYTYDSCDTGTFPNQTSKSGAPAAAATGSPEGGTISFLPGQRVSACTCSGGDHPGPSVSVGRGVPEIDILEAQVDVSIMEGQVSQSAQIAPFDYQYTWDESSPATKIYNKNLTAFNSYKGGIYQQAESAVTYINSSGYGGNGYATYGFEWFSNPSDRDKGFVTWYSEGQPAWTLTTASIGPDSKMEIGQRLISEEPMYIILNFGLSPSFQQQDWKHLEFPSKMYVDYVRVYQREGTSTDGLTCDPPKYPTADYINSHLNAYSDSNLTTWAQAGYTRPSNSLYDGC